MDRSDVYMDEQSFTPGRVTVDLEFTAGTSGAVPSTLTRAKGIASVTKSTNDYIVTFQDAYVAYVNGYGGIIQASVDATKAFRLAVTAVSLANKTVTLSPTAADGTAQPLVSGDILRWTFVYTRLQGNY